MVIVSIFESAKERKRGECGMNEMMSVPVKNIDKLLACCDGQTALLYLHVLRSGAFSMTKAAKELGWSQEETALAADKLRKLGLMQGEEALPSAEEMPQYEAADIVSRAKTDSAFEGLVFEVQQALGKLLSTNDLRLLFGIYDHLGLPAEVILLLVNHCVEHYRTMNGEGRMPTMRYIEKEAWHWAKLEIINLESAEEHIRMEKLRGEAVEQVKAILQIKGRSLTESERRYVSSWLDMGFEAEALAIAYDRTVIGTGKLAWKYMDKIVHAWHEKNLHTPQEIERGDYRRPQTDAAPGPDKRTSELDTMRRMYEQMKNRR